MPTFLALVEMFVSVLLIGVILLQRGRGGGLVGALSGLGGQSALGTKAGDMFTRITIGIAVVWVLLAGIHGQVLRSHTEKFKNDVSEKQIFSSPADKAKSGESTKSDDTESGLGSLSSDSKKEPASEGGSKSKSDESAKEITVEDGKKTDAAPKTKEPSKKELDDSAEGKSEDKSSGTK